MKHWWQWLMLTVLCLAVCGCGKSSTAEVPPPLVKTMTIGATETAAEHSFSGTVHGRTESPLGFQIPGKIVHKFVQSGDRVQTGDPLFSLDANDVEAQVDAAQGQVDAAAAQLELANKTLSRMETLYAQDAISALKIDEVRSKQQLAQAQYDQAQAALYRAQNQASFATLRADRDGVIGMIMAEIGQVVSAGMPVVAIVDNSNLDVQISLTEKNISDYPVGSSAEVTFWALPDQKSTAVMREVSPAPNPKTGTYDAKLTLSDPPAQLALGSTAEVRFTGASGEQILVPLSALAPQSKTPAVWVVRDEKVTLVNVTTGAYRGDQVEITSGLNKGDRVVVAGAQNLTEGQAVRI